MDFFKKENHTTWMKSLDRLDKFGVCFLLGIFVHLGDTSYQSTEIENEHQTALV